MSYTWEDSLVITAGEMLSVLSNVGCADAVVPSFEHDRWNGDPWLLRDQVFESLVLRVALDEPIPVAVRVDDDVDEIGVVKARSACGKCLGCVTSHR